MFLFFYLKLITNIILKTPLVITRMNEPDQQLIGLRNKLRLQTIKEKSYSKDSNNIVHIEEYSDGFFKIRFGISNYLYKNPDDASVITRKKKGEDIGTIDKDVGFAWEILYAPRGYKILSRGLCLQVSGFSENTESLYLTGERCTNNNKQLFNITRAVIKNSDKANEKENKTIKSGFKSIINFKNNVESDLEGKIVNINILVKSEDTHKIIHKWKRKRYVKKEHKHF